MTGRAKITELQQSFSIIDQDVVGLDVGVEDVALSQVLQGQQELLGVAPDGGHIDAHLLAILFQDFSQVHGQGLEGQTQMLLVKEASVQPETVKLVIRIRLVQPSKDLQFFQTSFVHDFVVPDDFDAHFFATTSCVTGTNYVGEHTLASVSKDMISLIQDFTRLHSAKPKKSFL